MSATFARPVLLSCLVMTLTGLLGNEGCQQAKSRKRELKVETRVDLLKSPAITLPNGETVDFPYLVQTLFADDIAKSPHFYTPYRTKAWSDGDIELLTSQGLNSVKSLAAPSCFETAPQISMEGDVLNFAVSYGGGFEFGFTPGGPIPIESPVSGHFKLSEARLSLTLRTFSGLEDIQLALADGVSYSEKLDFGFKVDAGVSLGLDFFYQSALDKVVSDAIQKSLKQMQKTMALQEEGDWNKVWQARVFAAAGSVNNDTHVAFRGGRLAGVKAGDKFALYQTEYIWQGAPCTSSLLRWYVLDSDPYATVEVKIVGDNVAIAEVHSLREVAIRPGDVVKVQALFEPPPPKVP